jgi:hypothetical protein
MHINIKTVRSFTSGYWQTVAIAFAGLVAVSGLLIYRLGNLLPGASGVEAGNLMASRKLHDILSNPTFGLYRLVQYAAYSLNHQNLFTTRLVSCAFGVLTVVLMYITLRQFKSNRVALIGSFLFATSSWFLTFARLGAPAVSYMLILAAITYGTWMRRTKNTNLVLMLGAALAAVLVYTPGLIWVVMIAIIWQKRTIIRLVAKSPKMSILAGIIFSALLIPMAFALYHQPSLYKSLLGLSATPVDSLGMMLDRLANAGSALFLHGQTNAVLGLVRTPILDLFTSVMAVLGVYACIFERKLDRTRMLGGGFLVGAILYALHGSVSIIILAPFIYIFASIGIAYMLDNWFKVFPRNPVARNVGVGLIISALLITSYFHLSRYFIAWPNAPETKQAYNIRL